ncbi:MAG: hypothetical protein HQK78_15420 [Desulfobacterales bacterium]|nr:hypothetical protein [Desulfobacterales bacterium]
MTSTDKIKKGKFAAKAENILRPENKPKSIDDFLSDSNENVNPEIQKNNIAEKHEVVNQETQKNDITELRKSAILKEHENVNPEIQKNNIAEKHEIVNQETQKNDITELRKLNDIEKKVRHELQIDYDLSEKIRKYCFYNRMTKRAVVELALSEFFKKREL